MRLTREQQQIIKTNVAEIFGSNARVLLFGSRVNDNEKGGDIHLLIELDLPIDEQLKKNLMLNASLQIALGLQKIDIITHIKNTPATPLYTEALQTGIPL
jgi:predicted nucleotidyltransferase